jgi:hypothetical protein
MHLNALIGALRMRIRGDEMHQNQRNSLVQPTAGPVYIDVER